MQQSSLIPHRTRLLRNHVDFYLPPVFRSRREDEVSIGKLPTEALVERIATLRPQTWLITGSAGSGKSSALLNIALHLLDRDVACLILNNSTIRYGNFDGISIRDAAKRYCPAEVPEKQWASWAKHGKIVLLVDGVNEIAREFEPQPAWRFVREVLEGGHKFPVLATSRYEPDDLGSASMRTIERLELPPHSADDIKKYIELRGGSADALLAEIEAAGMSGAISNPFLLSLLVDWKLQSVNADHSVPRSRAELLGCAVDHAEVAGRLSKAEKALKEHGLTMTAGLCAVALATFCSGKANAEFEVADVRALLNKVWPHRSEVEDTLRVFLDTQMVDRPSHPTSDTKIYQLSHPAFIDFGLASGWRHSTVPTFGWDPSYLDQCLGDWIGLQPDPDAAALRLVASEGAGPRFDVLVDVLVANRGVLSPHTQQQIWRRLGEGFLSTRNARDGLATALSRLPGWLIREGIQAGLLRKIAQQSPAFAGSLRLALIRREFDPTTLQRMRRNHLFRSNASNSKPTRVVAVSAESIANRERWVRTATNPDSRRKSANWLGSYAGPDSSLALMEAVADDPAFVVRGSAAKALGAIGRSDALPALTKALKDDAPSVRGSAATAIGAIRNVLAMPALVAALHDEVAEVRGSAATALGAIGDSDAVPALTKALDDDAPNVRGSAATALRVIGHWSAVPALTSALDDRDAGVRGAAATALGAIGDPGAVPALTSRLTDNDGGVRGSAATALGAIGNSDALPALTERLTDNDPGVRGSVATALGSIGHPGAVTVLTSALDDGQPEVRGAAATALGVIGSPDAVPALTRALTDASVIVGGSAATALGAIGHPDAIPALTQALSDNDAETRGSAATALGAIGHPDAIPALTDALADQDDAVRGSAAAALGRVGTTATLPVLRSTIVNRAESDWTRASAVHAYALLGGTSGDWLMEVADELRHHRQMDGSPTHPSNTLQSARKLRGTIVGAISRRAVTDDTRAWLENVARGDPDPINRTNAIDGLRRSKAVGAELLAYTLSPTSPRRDKRAHDTDAGVLGVAAAAVLWLAGQEEQEAMALLIGVVDLLVAEETWGSTINAALLPLERLDLALAERLLSAIEKHAADKQDVNPRFASAVGRHRVQLNERWRAQADMDALVKSPESVLSNFRSEVRSRFEMPTGPSRYDVALITTVPNETKALFMVLNEQKLNTESIQESGRYFDTFSLPSANGQSEVSVVTAQATDKGGQSAAAVTQAVISEFKPKLILLVGVCGGFAERGVHLNDVILAKSVFNYDPERVQPDGLGVRPQNYRSDEQLLRLVNYLEAKGFLDTSLAGGKLHVKDFASGEKVIAWKESELRQQLLNLSTDVYGVETEAHGVLHSVWETFKQDNFVGGGMIKCVSDSGDEQMAVDKDARQLDAGCRAVRFALEVIRHFKRENSSL